MKLHARLRNFRPGRRGWAVLITVVAFSAGIIVSRTVLPYVTGGVGTSWIPGLATSQPAPGDSPTSTAHDHAHGPGAETAHTGHDDANSLELSAAARRNIGLKTGPVKLSDFRRSIVVPAIVAERPGRTTFRIAAPLTGVITDVFASSGEAVESGDVLFILRLTHEDLVQAQTEFLKTLESLDVENREIERLENITQGVVAGKVVLERKYEKQKLEGQLKAQREALLLHGLTDTQVDTITTRRRLLRELRVAVPEIHDETDDEHLRSHHDETAGTARPRARGLMNDVDSVAGADVDSDVDANAGADDVSDNVSEAQRSHTDEEESPLLILQDLRVDKGDFVEAGATLVSLVDLHALYIEGRAFEQDATQISDAARLGYDITAIPEHARGAAAPIEGLHIIYTSNQIETQSRALLFYVNLPNEVVRDDQLPDGRRFVTWRFKPGQRMRLRIPVDSWPDQIVVPIDAVADDGAESFVFVRNRTHFDRAAVHVLYRDKDNAVLANDGTLPLGAVIAINSAHQLQMALENASGSGPDAHPGHTH